MKVKNFLIMAILLMISIISFGQLPKYDVVYTLSSKSVTAYGHQYDSSITATLYATTNAMNVQMEIVPFQIDIDTSLPVAIGYKASLLRQVFNSSSATDSVRSTIDAGDPKNEDAISVTISPNGFVGKITYKFLVYQTDPDLYEYRDTISLTIVSNSISGINNQLPVKPTISVYPNPSAGNFTVACENVGLTVYDMTGKTVIATQAYTQSFAVDKPGIYIVSIMTDAGIYNDRIIVK